MFISQLMQQQKAHQQVAVLEMLIMLGMFAVIFYFMIYRPQAKRVKEHKKPYGFYGQR